MSAKLLLLSLFILCATFAQETQDENFSPQEMQEISLSDSLELSQDSLGFLPDSLELSQEADVEITEIAPKKHFWYFSLQPRIGADKIQKDYSDFLKRRGNALNDSVRSKSSDLRLSPIWYQEANAPGVSFNFETGFSTKINERTSLSVGLGYSFNRIRAVYSLEGAWDSVSVLKTSSRLVNNTLSLSAGTRTAFDTEFFSVTGVEEAGFYGGAKFLYSRYFERDTVSGNYAEFNYKRRKNYGGFGAGGRLGIFARQKIGERALFEYSLGYLISAVVGYEEFWDRAKYWENAKSGGKITSVSNNMELSFSLFF